MPKYVVSESFGGKNLSGHSKLPAARKAAKRYSLKGPVDIWTTQGGSLGMGRRIAHYNEGKVVRVNPRRKTKKSSGGTTLRVSIPKGQSITGTVKRLRRILGSRLKKVQLIGKVKRSRKR